MVKNYQKMYDQGPRRAGVQLTLISTIVFHAHLLVDYDLRIDFLVDQIRHKGPNNKKMDALHLSIGHVNLIGKDLFACFNLSYCQHVVIDSWIEVYAKSWVC